jgi:hypothetical protein
MFFVSSVWQCYRSILVYKQLYLHSMLVIYLFFRRDSPQWALASSFTRFLDHTQRRITVGRIPLDEWSFRRRDLYLTRHNTHNRQTSMLWWDSNPQSQQGSGRRPTPYTARPLGPACWLYYRPEIVSCESHVRKQSRVNTDREKAFHFMIPNLSKIPNSVYKNNDKCGGHNLFPLQRYVLTYR